MTQTLPCDRCGGAVTFQDGETFLPCPYCGTLQALPDELRAAAETAAAEQAVRRLSTQAPRWLILFVVVVFILPTCLGICGSLVGALAGFLGPLAAVLASLFR